MIVDIEKRRKRVYHFSAEDKWDLIPGSSKIANIPEDSILAYGKLRSLFGEPVYETKNMEDQYLYSLRGQDEKGQEVFIYVYSGPSGPAIGGLNDRDSLEAAEQLIELIKNAAPADYDYTGYYTDFFLKIHEGIKDGIPFCKETPVDPEEIEF